MMNVTLRQLIPSHRTASGIQITPAIAWKKRARGMKNAATARFVPTTIPKVIPSVAPTRNPTTMRVMLDSTASSSTPWRARSTASWNTALGDGRTYRGTPPHGVVAAHQATTAIANGRVRSTSRRAPLGRNPDGIAGVAVATRLRLHHLDAPVLDGVRLEGQQHEPVRQ